MDDQDDLRNQVHFLPEFDDIHLHADFRGVVTEYFGEDPGQIMPSRQQLLRCIGVKLSPLRQQLFIGRFRLDQPGPQKNYRSVEVLAVLRQASIPATQTAINATDSLVKRSLRSIVYPHVDSWGQWATKQVLRSHIVKTKQDIFAFEQSLATMPQNGVECGQWTELAEQDKPYRVFSSVSLYRQRLLVTIKVYGTTVAVEVTLESQACTQTLLNPQDGEILEWLQENYRRLGKG